MSVYRNYTSHPVSWTGAMCLPSLMHEAAYCQQRSCWLHKAVSKKKCACMCTKPVKTWHTAYEWLHQFCWPSKMTVHLEMLSSAVAQKEDLVFFSLASGEKRSPQLRSSDTGKKTFIFPFSDGSWLVFWNNNVRQAVKGPWLILWSATAFLYNLGHGFFLPSRCPPLQ